MIGQGINPDINRITVNIEGMRVLQSQEEIDTSEDIDAREVDPEDEKGVGHPKICRDNRKASEDSK